MLMLSDGFRKSTVELNEVYFSTYSVKDWWHLLRHDKYKKIIIESLKFLSKNGLANVYGFVIMPNHLHLLWELLKMNGKEMPNASFSKFTSHKITHDLRKFHIDELHNIQVEESDRNYRIWQRDSLAVQIYNELMCEQKLDYIHNNPLQEHWNLADEPENYYWSSAKFYETGIDDLGFLTHYNERFG